MAENHVYRSVLFMPASNARALEKARTLPCDAVILDLEDAVAPDDKIVARQQAAAAVTSGAYGSRRLVIRVNGLDTDWWQDDMQAAVAAKPHAICIPKISRAKDVQAAASLLEKLAADETIQVWAMLETPAAFLKARKIAASHPRLTTLVLGLNDLALELRAKHVPGRWTMMTALQTALLAGRAEGLNVLDAVYNDFRDEDGFRAECEQARDMGFDGKTLIHPAQIAPANEIFSPSEGQITDAKQIIAAFEEDDSGVAVLNGKMIEELHVVEARRVLALAGQIKAKE